MSNKEEAPLVPKLRFPEFRRAEGWAAESLGTVADFVNERISLERISLDNYVSTQNILPNYGGIDSASKLPTTGSATRYEVNDALVSNIRPYLKKVWFADKAGGASNDVIVIRAKERLLPQYFAFLLKNDAFIDYVMIGAKGVKMPRGDIGSMKDYRAPYPKKSEQQKIADCLSSLDELIAAKTRKVDALKLHKEGLMLQLFPGEGEAEPRLRLSEFRGTGAWQERKMSALLIKSVNPVDVDSAMAYREIGIRSHGKGIFHKEPVRGQALREKRVFWAVEDALVLNIVFAWEQALAVTSAAEAGMIASHRFPMFKARPGKADVNFVKYFFLTKKGKELLGIASPGGAGRNKTLGKKDFDNLEFLLPSNAEEQNGIANLLTSIDTLIVSQIQQLDTLKTHKKGLMQQLFPSMEALPA